MGSHCKYYKRRYSYPRTINGEHIISSDNALFFVEVDYRYPSINKIIQFGEDYEVNAGYAKEVIIDAEGHPTRHREAVRDVEDIFGEGYVREYDRSAYEEDERQNRAGKGNNRGTNSQRNRKDEVSNFSLRNQKATARDILMQTDPQTQKNNVKGHLTGYQERVVQLVKAGVGEKR